MSKVLWRGLQAIKANISFIQEQIKENKDLGLDYSDEAKELKSLLAAARLTSDLLKIQDIENYFDE